MGQDLHPDFYRKEACVCVDSSWMSLRVLQPACWQPRCALTSQLSYILKVFH